MKLFNLFSSIVGNLETPLTVFWEAWGIQLLVNVGLACQIILAVVAERRRHMTSVVVRGLILAAYFLSSSVATVALSKLILVQTNYPDQPDYVSELKRLLAPLLLMHLGYPDSIIAYSVEDSQLGIREALNLGVMVCFVLWILISHWSFSSHVVFLYLPLFTAGIIRSGEMVWALKSLYWERSRILAKDTFNPEGVAKFFAEKDVRDLFNEHEVHGWVRKQNIILKAYYRFDCLKPHIANWHYHPIMLKKSQLIVDPDLAFITTELELGFMYDALYTKKRILYKRLCLIGRFASFLCLVSALCIFTFVFKRTFLIDMYIAHTYALLIGVTALEGYQIVLLPFSKWAIVAMSRHQSNPLVSTRLLHFAVEMFMKRKRWSNSFGQLDLLDPRQYDDWPRPIRRILTCWNKIDVTFRRHRSCSRLKIGLPLKKLLVKGIEKLEEIRRGKPFTKRRAWTLNKLSHDQVLKRYISGTFATSVTFSESIIIWHMATNICLFSVPENSHYCNGSKLLSNYMMYLLARRPYTLSLTTSDITLEHACAILKPFLRYRDRREALRILPSPEEIVLEPYLDPRTVPKITRDWRVLTNAKELAARLKDKEDMWQIISSMWVEMLCFAAYTCPVHHHSKLLRQGGELITHVWLLLMHETDKYPHNGKSKSEA